MQEMWVLFLLHWTVLIQCWTVSSTQLLGESIYYLSSDIYKALSNPHHLPSMSRDIYASCLPKSIFPPKIQEPPPSISCLQSKQAHSVFIKEPLESLYLLPCITHIIPYHSNLLSRIRSLKVLPSYCKYRISSIYLNAYLLLSTLSTLRTSFATVAIPSTKFPYLSNIHRPLVHSPELLQVVPLSMSSTSLATASSSEEILELPPASSTPSTASPFASHSFLSLEPHSHFYLVPHSLMCSSSLSLNFQFIPSFPI
jgi:hypothetical protein